MSRCLFPALLLALAACSADNSLTATDNAIDAACASAPALDLAVGTDTVINLTSRAGCVRLATTGDREYLALAYGASGLVLPSGLRADAIARTGAARPVPTPSARIVDDAPFGQRAVDLAHRRRESAAAVAFAPRRLTASATASAPTVGDRRQFIACADIACATTLTVTANARIVGRRVAIYVDSLAPAGGYTDTELAAAAALFDDYIFPIDTLAFGTPSDIDANGVVIALLTPAVNGLSGAGCRNGVVLGYFDGTDLLPNAPGSNGGEIFFAEVPDPAGACPVTKARALNDLPVTFVHELQHMISFRQHVLERGGNTESIWLNEGLSHLAEELAGRAVPEAPGAPVNRLTQFALTNLDNAYSYLLDPDGAALVFGSASSGSPSERGAAWLFLRWLADQYRGTQGAEAVTRRLLETSRTGAANVAAAVGVPFERLAGRWLLAAFADDLPDAQLAPDLQFTSWNLRTTFERLFQQDPGRFPRPFPLVPPVLGPEAVARRLTLRGGSGELLRIRVGGTSGPFALQVTDTASAALTALLEPRLLIARTR
jgi:hypothetical protein